MLRRYHGALAVLVVTLVGVTGSTKCPDVENQEQHVFQLEDDKVCYEYVVSVEDDVSYSEAVKSCSSKDGYLMTIKNNNTQVKIVTKLQELSESHTILLGLKRHGNVWKWPTGETATYTNWKQLSTKCNNCNCAKMMLQDEGLWEPFDCGVSAWYPAYVCEYGAAFSINTHDRQQQIIVAVFAVLSMVSVSFTGRH